MSTHRKIEWTLFVLGVIGLGLSLGTGGSMVQVSLYGLVALFAGLHAFHLYDGHKANHIVVAASLGVVVYVGYVLATAGGVLSNYGLLASLALGVLLSVLSLRLRQDFHPR